MRHGSANRIRVGLPRSGSRDKGPRPIGGDQLTTATQCTYEVLPFSYSQEDTFKDGKEYPPIVYYDGLYRGVNCYDIKYGHV